MQSPASKAPEDAARLRDLRLKAAAVLGKGHWTYFLATFAWLQKCFNRSKQIVVIVVCFWLSIQTCLQMLGKSFGGSPNCVLIATFSPRLQRQVFGIDAE